MKFRIDTRRILTVLIGFVVIVGGIFLYARLGFDHMETRSFSIKDLKPIDEEISTALPHQQYQKLTDSVARRRDRKNGQTGDFLQVAVLGAGKTNFCETCEDTFDWKGRTEYHLALIFWKLKSQRFDKKITYYVEHGQSYLRYLTCGPNVSNNPKKEVRHCQEVDKPVPFRYDIKNDVLQIPITEKSYNVLRWVLYASFLLLVIFVLYYIVLVFLKFLQEIAYGEPFCETNVRRLKTIAINLIILPVSALIITLILRLVYAKYFTSELELNAEIWNLFTKPVILSITFAALHIAFKKGKKLQDEIDLTV